MEGVGYILLGCVLFIHLGLGDAISKVIKRCLSLFNCVKCFTFWTMLAYTALFFEWSFIKCVAVAFVSAYAALWIDLFFAKLSTKYEKWYKGVVAEEGKHCSSNTNEKGKSKTRQEG